MQLRSTALRLWFPISLSMVLHVLALMSLHDMLLHGKSGQLEGGTDQGLRVQLIDFRASSNQTAPRQDNAATPISNVPLPGRSLDLAQASSDAQKAAPTTLQKALTTASPAHPQRLADGAAAVSATSRGSADGVVVKPQAANGGKGNFDSSYIPSTMVQRAPIPLTQPDMYRLAAIPRPRGPITLRAYVEKSGAVSDVIVVSCEPDDQASADAIAKLFKDVSYIAAYDHGQQVPSKIDFTITLSDASLPGDRPDARLIRKSQP